ncbi:hypothetical protein J7E96_29650 [Streptomyces sp. ISL-96]|uniref:hypothetical protein n=1 Tax=Streptomyces sp. ISL-96 TaxID=2819191 RepID=UPI001BE627CF|nr:hypothetical protein [Streptomyces sp. ISL-96]MBT2492600.1 hypothetical protein [Streptomyces sp. ISL-96]
MAVTFRIRRRAAVLAGSVLLVSGLPFTLSACGSADPPAGQPAGEPALVSVEFGPTLTDALKAQVAAAEQAANSAKDSRKVCTTDPADRSACRNPSGKIDPNGGDVDGDGVFEPHEPVGPGYKDPRAYDGGKTSGETQCEWLRSQGIAC